MLSYCHLHVTAFGHKCSMRPEKLSAEDMERFLNAQFVFFDFETYVKEKHQLVPNHALRDVLTKENASLLERSFCRLSKTCTAKNGFFVQYNKTLG